MLFYRCARGWACTSLGLAHAISTTVCFHSASFNKQKIAKERYDDQMVKPQRIQSNLNSAMLVTFANLKCMLLLWCCGSHPKQDGIHKWTPCQLRHLHLEHFDWGLYGLALDHGCQMAKFDPFLSLDCTRVEGVGAQSKERKGSNFAA